MHELQLADEIVQKIREQDGRYHERAYLFVLAALEYCQRRRKARGHISGPELAAACRDFAIDQFGLTARTVLSFWGVQSTGDFGKIVFVLIEVGLLIQHPNDRIEDFESVYDFAQAFEGDYPWGGVASANSQK
jgi:uncharacterized repeat protein (TIGR04138 family)